jgi:hypothetical protein
MKNSFGIFIAIFFISACSSDSTVTGTRKKKKQKKDFIFTERMITGTDTAMITLTSGIDDVLAQHWFLDDVSAVSDDKLVWENGSGSRLFPSLNLFKDSSALENPRSDLQIASWHRQLKNKINSVIMNYGKNKIRSYRIRQLSQRNLTISWNDGNDSLWLKYHSDGMAHQNILNDPFHPRNNGWRIKPVRIESEAEIKKRVKGCVRFYALYFRDNIKRHKEIIEFLGLPEIFTWYNGGIGLPEKKDIGNSWVACFYNKVQADQGYSVLVNLLADNDFDWPTGTPGWHYRTLSVLEQMHEKL